MQNTQEILDTITRSKQYLSATYKLQSVGVFGSVIRGEHHEGSDVDVLVDLGAQTDLLDLIGIGQYLEERLLVKVDVVPRITLRPELMEQVLREVRYL